MTCEQDTLTHEQDASNANEQRCLLGSESYVFNSTSETSTSKNDISENSTPQVGSNVDSGGKQGGSTSSEAEDSGSKHYCNEEECSCESKAGIPTMERAPLPRVELYRDKTFESWEECQELLERYARQNKFVIRKKRVDNSRDPHSRTWDCE